MRVVGLTGGIGSGKSEVARVFRDAGIPVIDADLVGRELMAPSTRLCRAVLTAFGPGIAAADGGIDRAALADLVFGNAAPLKALNDLVHPAVFAEVSRRLAGLARVGHPVCVIEAALLVETDADREMDGLLVVSAPEDVRMARVLARDRVTRDAFLARCQHQVAESARVARATWILHNHNTLDALQIQARSMAVLIARPSQGRLPN